MSKAVKCPVCEGSGKIMPYNDGRSTAVPQLQVCYGCLGKGWEEVGLTDHEKRETISPYKYSGTPPFGFTTTCGDFGSIG